MPNGVRRLLPMGAGEGRIAGSRQHAVFGKHYIESDRAAILRFPPYPEMAREPLA
jgi:hypothetical protein